MGYSIRLAKVKGLEESGEVTTADEPYVLVTAVDLAWTPIPAPNPRLPPTTFRYGEWNNFDANETLTLVGELPFWEDPVQRTLTDPASVCFIVSVLEHDEGNMDAYRGAVQTAAISSVTTSVGLPRATRVTRLLADIRSAIGLLDLPSLDDHIETKELRLDASDLVPLGTVRDRVLEFGGEPGKWELTFRIAHHRRVVFPPGARFAAVTRSPDKMEVWAVDAQGQMRGNFFEGRWHGWYTLPGPEFPAGCHVSAVTRHADHMEVWAVDRDGVVQGNWFNGAQWMGWYALSGTEFPPGGRLAAVSRDPDHIHVWGVDIHGKAVERFADTVAWSSQWEQIGPPRNFPPGAPIAAASLAPHHLEVWIVAEHSPILGIRHDDAWGDWYPLGDIVFSPSTEIAALRRHQTLSVFAIDATGHVRDEYFDGTDWRGWYEAGTQTFTSGAPIAATTQHAAHMQLFAQAAGGVISTDPYDASQWLGWQPLLGLALDEGTHMAALSRFEGHMEMWALQSGVVWGTWFMDGAWRDWYPLLWSYEG